MSSDKEKVIDVESAPTQAVVKREEDVESKAPITAAQAKVEAIADLTHSAYQKAATLQLTPEESAALKADFPDEAFKTGAAGKENLLYIEHAFLRDRFSQVFGMGQWAIIPRRSWGEKFIIPAYRDKPEVEGERVYVEAMLVVRGCFVGEAIGAMEYYPKNQSQNYGDAVEGAKTAAFRRCAKEFGVGLQAWKKDWCEGWWARKRAPRPTPRANPPPKPAEKPKAAPKLPTEATRKWMIEQLLANGENEKIVTDYFRKLGQLMDNESVNELPLRFVPFDRKEMGALSACIARFEMGDAAEAAFDQHTEADAPPKSNGEKSKSSPTVSPTPTGTTSHDDEWWRDVIVPIPHKGEKRDAYLKNPDTIGSLHDARHDDEEARKRLWGFANHYEPKGWVKKDGTQMPASAADLKFREALDAYVEWFEKNHPGENL